MNAQDADDIADRIKHARSYKEQDKKEKDKERCMH